MKKIYLLILAFLISGFHVDAQSLEELKAQKSELASEASEKQAELDALNGQIGNLNKEIEFLSGWLTGFSGNLGFNFNKSNNWISNPNINARSSSLNLGLSVHANKLTKRIIWRNKGILNKAWQDVDLTQADLEQENDGLFNNGTVDILNLSSLLGYRINDKISLTTLAEVNTSLEKFLSPGSFDIGFGATYTPVSNAVVVLHPFNYHVGFSGQDGIESSGALGAKLRADYTQSFDLSGKSVEWSSTITSFIPYSDTRTTVLVNPDDPTMGEYQAGLFEYTWVNTLSFELWKGIGLGVGFGLRNADFESQKVQSYYTFGLSYKFKK